MTMSSDFEREPAPPPEAMVGSAVDGVPEGVPIEVGHPGGEAA